MSIGNRHTARWLLAVNLTLAGVTLLLGAVVCTTSPQRVDPPGRVELAPGDGREPTVLARGILIDPAGISFGGARQETVPGVMLSITSEADQADRLAA